MYSSEARPESPDLSHLNHRGGNIILHVAALLWRAQAASNAGIWKMFILFENKKAALVLWGFLYGDEFLKSPQRSITQVKMN